MSVGAANPRRPPERLSGVLLLAALLFLWEASARLGWVSSANWPPVSGVIVALGRGLADGDLSGPLLATLRRTALGYGAGCSVGVAMGLLLGSFRPAGWVLRPILEVVRPIPVPAVIPPLILLLGVDDALKVFVIALSCFFPVFTSTYDGVRSLDETLRATARTFRIGRWRTLFRVALPATLPAIATGLRTATSLALVVAVIAEMIAGSSGIGYLIEQSQFALQPERMYAALLATAASGYAINRMFLLGERRLIPWLGKA